MNQLKVATFAVAGLAASACTADDISPIIPDAQDDFVDIEMAGAVTTDVLANDLGLDGYQGIEIVRPPTAGVAEVTDDGMVWYEPVAEYIGADAITYRVMAENGSSSEATMHIDVACEDCANGRNIRLRWLPNNPVEELDGYRIYAGPTDAPAELEMITDVGTHTADFDMDQPSVVYDAWYDLGLTLGSEICFRATAYNEYGESDFSNSACKQIHGLKWDYEVHME